MTIIYLFGLLSNITFAYSESFELGHTSCHLNRLVTLPDCDSIRWTKWSYGGGSMVQGTIGSGNVQLDLDPKTGLTNPMLNSITLSNLTLSPKTISKMPTPWMPGGGSSVTLLHHLTVNFNISQELILLVGSSPNPFHYPNSSSKLRIFDKSNKQLNISNIELIGEDFLGVLNPTSVLNSGTELAFRINNSGGDGSILFFKNLPRESYLIEFEHTNGSGSSDDCIYINIGLPDCCASHVRIDSVGCKEIVFKGTKINGSGIYLDTLRSYRGCDSVVELNYTRDPSFNTSSRTNLTICKGDSLELNVDSLSAKWANGESGPKIKIYQGGTFWAEYSTFCGMHRDSFSVKEENCTNPCNLTCDTLDWPSYKQLNQTMYRGFTKVGSFKLNLDPNTGLQFPLFNNINLSTSNIYPKTIPLVPTLWMPGRTGANTLIHKIILDSIKVDENLLIFLGEFPNEAIYSGPQTGKLRIFDKSLNLLQVDSLCVVFRDARNLWSPTNITNLGNEIHFNVNTPGGGDGDVFLLKNLPPNSFIVEVEHYNEISSKDDGIYVNVAYPSCCINDTVRIDTVSCSDFNFQGQKIVLSGTYYASKPKGSCYSITELHAIIQSPQLFKLREDTSFCEAFDLTVSAPFGFKNYQWSNGQSGRTTSFNQFGMVSCCAVDSCERTICDTFTITKRPPFSITVTKDTTVSLGSFIQLDTKVSGGDPKATYLFHWQPSSGLTCTNCANPIAAVRHAQKYCVTASDDLSHCNSTECVNIRVECCIGH
ncbi:MAG TPA: hypothetical protein PKZ51_14430 [Saprospiraceae bacterium]|nr:hypothetical protein [Saprospiraceae bacterium]